ncbi:MAG: Bug family tripartite tricarboxylate transporter substrate binding protein [Vitreimonas sp.]
MNRRSVCALLALSLLASSASIKALSAESYPTKPIKIIVPLAPGGVADIVARALAAKLSESGKTAVVENRTGGGGVIGAEAAAKSPPDGYTLYMGFHTTQSILPHLMANLPYDPAKDFAPIIFLATAPNVLVVHPSIPAKSPSELIAYARANPGKLNVGTPGAGSSDHLAAEQFRQLHGLDIAHVHYRGAAPAMQELVGGHVQLMFAILPLAGQQQAAGKVRALAVMSARREPSIPEVPTMAEAGTPGIEGGPWFGLLAPAGTPKPIIDWLNAEATKAFTSADLKTRFETQGLTLPLGSPEDFAKHIAAETLRWGEVIRKGNVKIE